MIDNFLFNFKGKRYIFFPEYSRVFALVGEITAKNVKEFLLKKQYQVPSSDYPFSNKIKTITLLLTNACNLKCRYCFEQQFPKECKISKNKIIENFKTGIKLFASPTSAIGGVRLS